MTAFIAKKTRKPTEGNQQNLQKYLLRVLQVRICRSFCFFIRIKEVAL